MYCNMSRLYTYIIARYSSKKKKKNKLARYKTILIRVKEIAVKPTCVSEIPGDFTGHLRRLLEHFCSAILQLSVAY